MRFSMPFTNTIWLGFLWFLSSVVSSLLIMKKKHGGRCEQYFIQKRAEMTSIKMDLVWQLFIHWKSKKENKWWVKIKEIYLKKIQGYYIYSYTYSLYLQFYVYTHVLYLPYLHLYINDYLQKCDGLDMGKSQCAQSHSTKAKSIPPRNSIRIVSGVQLPLPLPNMFGNVGSHPCPILRSHPWRIVVGTWWWWRRRARWWWWRRWWCRIGEQM